MRPILFDSHFLLNFHEDWQQLNGRFLKQTKSLVRDNTYISNVVRLGAIRTALLCELLNVELALILAFVYQVMSNLDGLIRVKHSVLMLVDLTEQSADLHVRFAAVLQHL